MIQPNSQLLITESELERALDGDSSPRSIAPQYDELTKYLQSEALDVQTHTFEAISDDEEEDVELRLDTPAAISIMQTTPNAPPLSAVAAGKRSAVTSSGEEDSDADGFANPEENLSLSFPDTQHRVSGRIRKKSRLLDGYII
ncbi:hypothetical protein N7508_007506 [Penicillium antarcticum]|uniref:uncharacterized protein n=1 Tax=Penicillium antarcticum TaxID=416450 RepID=UPI00239C2C10|nr:uncharacterized protein N7508_007506 [Penicillium antarcticum]KAJ5300263.1 hypothetical protein N7508_007506 [Penicillium antarcticum]